MLAVISKNSSAIKALVKVVQNDLAELSKLVTLNNNNAGGKLCRLQEEHKHLLNELETLVQEARTLLTINNGPQTQLPVDLVSSENTLATGTGIKDKVTEESTPKIANESSVENKLADGISNESAKLPKKEVKASNTATKGGDEINFGKLDLRVGRIINVEKHPNADTLYLEQVDVGEDKPRSVVSGLVNWVPIEDMKDRVAIFLCNLKPAKMRGISSEGMIMCANGGEKVEILMPPAGSVPGDPILVQGYKRDPDPVMNPKKKIWETVAVDLKVNEAGQATYKGIPWSVAEKGDVLAQTLRNVIIK